MTTELELFRFFINFVTPRTFLIFFLLFVFLTKLLHSYNTNRTVTAPLYTLATYSRRVNTNVSEKSQYWTVLDHR